MLLKKELEHATGVDTSSIAAKSDFIALKAEVNKLGITNWLMVQLVYMIYKQKYMILMLASSKKREIKKICDTVSKEVAKKTVQQTK